jgi:NAD(P)-dependent dehydrogenase (short-subunit alcohol dehydrogenase family)
MPEAFGPQTTTDDVLSGKDLSGLKVLITGVSAGLGVETARALAAHGAKVTGAARNLVKAREATRPIETLDLIELDLADLASVRVAADPGKRALNYLSASAPEPCGPGECESMAMAGEHVAAEGTSSTTSALGRNPIARSVEGKLRCPRR